MRSPTGILALPAEHAQYWHTFADATIEVYTDPEKALVVVQDAYDDYYVLHLQTFRRVTMFALGFEDACAMCSELLQLPIDFPNFNVEIELSDDLRCRVQEILEHYESDFNGDMLPSV